jgi:hypothetical protein
MTEYQKEQIENIRRQAEKSLKIALALVHHPLIDSSQNIIDLCETLQVKDIS